MAATMQGSRKAFSLSQKESLKQSPYHRATYAKLKSHFTPPPVAFIDDQGHTINNPDAMDLHFRKTWSKVDEGNASCHASTLLSYVCKSHQFLYFWSEQWFTTYHARGGWRHMQTLSSFLCWTWWLEPTRLQIASNPCLLMVGRFDVFFVWVLRSFVHTSVPPSVSSFVICLSFLVSAHPHYSDTNATLVRHDFKLVIRYESDTNSILTLTELENATYCFLQKASIICNVSRLTTHRTFLGSWLQNVVILSGKSYSPSTIAFVKRFGMSTWLLSSGEGTTGIKFEQGDDG